MTKHIPPQWAARLRQQRETKLLSQRDLAQALRKMAGTNVHLPEPESLVRNIRGWESGGHEPNALYQTLLRRVLDLPGTWPSEEPPSLELSAPLRLGPAVPTNATPDHSRAASPRPGDSGQGCDHLRQSLDELLNAGAMTEATLDEWEYAVTRYGEAARNRPAGLLLHELADDLGDLMQAMTRHRSASSLRRLTRAAAQMSGLMCLTLIKLDDRTAFPRWARTARVAAHEAGDQATYSWVLAQEAYGHYYAADFAQAIRLAQAAQHALTAPCAGAVLAAALEARAHAALGPARAPETQAALRRAETLLAALPAGEVNYSAFGYTEGQLRFHEGNAFTHLGDIEAAWRAQQEALRLCQTGDYMDRALTRLDRTICLVQQGDTSGALAYAAATLAPLSEQQRRGIISSRGRDVLNALPDQRALPAVRDLRELLAPTD